MITYMNTISYQEELKLIWDVPGIPGFLLADKLQEAVYWSIRKVRLLHLICVNIGYTHVKTAHHVSAKYMGEVYIYVTTHHTKVQNST